jgi:hypothetical protein
VIGVSAAAQPQEAGWGDPDWTAGIDEHGLPLAYDHRIMVLSAEVRGLASRSGSGGR